MEIIDVVPVSDTASTVIWSPPLQPNGIVTNYELMYSVYKNSTNISVNISSNAENFTITDLCKLHIFIVTIECVFVGVCMCGVCVCVCVFVRERHTHK